MMGNPRVIDYNRSVILPAVDPALLRDRLYEAYASQHAGPGNGEATALIDRRNLRPLLPPPDMGPVIDIRSSIWVDLHRKGVSKVRYGNSRDHPEMVRTIIERKFPLGWCAQVVRGPAHGEDVLISLSAGAPPERDDVWHSRSNR
jgi:hypothetical protein